MLKYSRYKQIEQKLSLQNTNATLIKTKKELQLFTDSPRVSWWNVYENQFADRIVRC